MRSNIQENYSISTSKQAEIQKRKDSQSYLDQKNLNKDLQESNSNQAEMSTSYTFNGLEQKTQNKDSKNFNKTPCTNDDTEALGDEENIMYQKNIVKDTNEIASLGDNCLESQTLIMKKPNFSVVCMLPTMHANMSVSMKDKTHQIIDPQTLQRILKLQEQYQIRKQSQDGKSSRLNVYADKIGLCGIPSLWISKDELIKEKHVTQDILMERERLERFLKILQIHKRYENEKYFGGGGMLKRNNIGQSSSMYNQALQSNPDFVIFSTDVLFQKQKGFKDEKTNFEQKDDTDVASGSQVFPQIRSFDNPEQFMFKILQAEAKLVRIILEAHGFLHTESNDWNVLWTCNSTQQKQYMYDNLNENQKINHFINSTELTRKDRLCFNVGKMQMKFGKNHFDFLPETYILPDEFSEFYKVFNQYQKENDETRRNMWIVKPSSSSQGKGIFMVDDISEVPLNESLVISRYIDNPLLINGLKFDLRLYVLVTSFDPLKIYIYNEGLVRFASEPYNNSNIKQNVYAHLTNYSINKKSENFVQNKNVNQRDQGHKWSLSALQLHLTKLGIDMKIVWERIYDAIIKSILSVESHVYNAIKKIQTVNANQNKSNAFDLFGFDIILDQDLKPWILEVNLSPSLAFDSPLDYHIKSNLLVDSLNIVGIKKYSRRREFLGKQLKVKNTQQSQAQQAQIDSKKRYQSALNISQLQGQQNSQNSLNKTDTSGQVQRQALAVEQILKNQYEGIDLNQIEKLSKISAKHRELLREHLEEFFRNKKNNFTRIYPSYGTNQYDVYFEQPRSLNKLLYKYLYQSTEFNDIASQINKSSNNYKQQTQTQQKYYDTYHQASDHTAPINRSSSMSSINNFNENQEKEIQPDKTEQIDHMMSPFNKKTRALTSGKIDLQNPNQDSITKTENSNRSRLKLIAKQDEKPKSEPAIINQEEKVIITGDDILIEYVKRVMNVVKLYQSEISSSQMRKLEMFLTHKVWYSKNQQNRQAENQGLWQRIEQKYIEMQERKKRLFTKKQAQEGIPQSISEKQFNSLERQKDDIIKDFSSQDLEQMLIQSNKNNQIEVVSILLYGTNTAISGMNYNSGVLTKIERDVVRISKNSSQMLKLLKINTETQENESGLMSPEKPSQDLNFVSPKDKDKSLHLTRMKTSDDKNQSYPFNYKTQQNVYEQLHSSYTNISSSGKTSVLYQSSQVSSNQNLLQKQQTKKQVSGANTVDRDNTYKVADNKRITLPQINNNHLSQDYSRVSVQLNSGGGVDSTDKYSKYRSRGSNEKFNVKKIREQSLQNESKNVSKLNKQPTKFERLDI